MNFEEALMAELESISGLDKKVYPLVAIDGAVAPYLIYRKNFLEAKLTLDGALTKYDGTYELALVSPSYSDLQGKSNLITEKLLSFLFRSIGIGGPTVSYIKVTQTGDSFESEPRLYRADYTIEIKY